MLYLGRPANTYEAHHRDSKLSLSLLDNVHWLSRTPEKTEAFRLNPKARISSNPPHRSHDLLIGSLYTNAFSGLAFRLGIVHSSRPTDYQTLVGRSTSYEVSAVTSSPRPKECEISSYRHGCDPPKKIHASPPSDRKDYLTTRASKQSLIRLIELQPSLLALVFRFHKNEACKL